MYGPSCDIVNCCGPMVLIISLWYQRSVTVYGSSPPVPQHHQQKDAEKPQNIKTIWLPEYQHKSHWEASL